MVLVWLKVMAALNSNHVNSAILLSIFLVLFDRQVNGNYGCNDSWVRQPGNSTMDHSYTIVVEPDQVYSLKSPGLCKLSYPRSSLFTWDIRTANEAEMSMMIYVSFFHTEGFCDILRLETFNQQMDNQGNYTDYTDYDLSSGSNLTYEGSGSGYDNASAPHSEAAISLPYQYDTDDDHHSVTYWTGNMVYAYDYRNYQEREINLEFAESRYAVLQFSTDSFKEIWSDAGFVIQILPLLDSRTHVEPEGWSYSTYRADSTVQQMVLYPVPLGHHTDMSIARVRIVAEEMSDRMAVDVIFMNVHNEPNCNNAFIEILDGGIERAMLMKSCRNMATSSPIQVISVSNSVVVRYKCNPLQLYNLREEGYETSPCAVLNYQIYETEGGAYADHDYFEILHADFGHPMEFGGNFLFLSLSVDLDVQLTLQSGRFETEEDTVQIKISPATSTHNKLSISHQLHGEHRVENFQYFERSKDGLEMQDVWIAFENNEVKAGLGHELGENVEITHTLPGCLQLKYFQVMGDSRGIVRYHGDCDKTFGDHLIPLSVTEEPGFIHHSVSKDSQYLRHWLIRKDYPDQILQLRVTSHLLMSPDCQWESITIYRGTCLSWKRRVVVVCGNVTEIYSEATHLDTVIQFQSRVDPSAGRAFDSGDSHRYFEIEYKVYQPDKLTDGKVFNFGLFFGIVVTIIIVAIVISIICYVQYSKTKQSRQITVQGAPALTLPQQHPYRQSQHYPKMPPQNNPQVPPQHHTNIVPRHHPNRIPHYHSNMLPQHQPNNLHHNHPDIPYHHPNMLPPNQPNNLPQNHPNIPYQHPNMLPPNQPNNLPQNQPNNLPQNHFNAVPQNHQNTLHQNNPNTFPQNHPNLPPQHHSNIIPQNNPNIFPQNNQNVLPQNNANTFPQNSTAQPIHLNINVDNAGKIEAVPDTLYHKGEVHTTVNYTGVPPPAVYDPDSLYRRQPALPRY